MYFVEEKQGVNDMRKLKAGIIGFGRSGRDIHYATLLRLTEKYQITAVSDSIADRLNDVKEKTGCAVYDDYKKLLFDKNVEVVINATPSFQHKQVTIEAMEAGKFVTVEKPAAPTVKEIDEMIAAAGKLKGRFSVFQNMRFEPLLFKIKDIMKTGKLGDIYLIRRQIGSYQRRDDWQAMKKFGGGAINNTLVHSLDQALFLTDFDIKRTSSLVLKLITAGDAEDFGKIMVVGNKTSLDIEITSASAYSFPIYVIFGKFGTVLVEKDGDDIVLKTKYLDPSKLRVLTRAEDIKSFSDYQYPSDKIEWIEETDRFVNDGYESCVRYHEAVWECVVNGGPIPVTPESARIVLDVIEKSKKENGF